MIQASEMFDQIVFTSQDLSSNEYTQFIALYLAIAALNLFSEH